MKKTLILLSCLAGAAVSNAQNLTDPEVAAVAVAANKIDVNQAEIAKKKSTNADVKNFAETMIKDHNAVLDQASALVKKLNVSPKENSLSKKLMGDAQTTKNELNKKSGAEFDKAYVDNEVAYHKAVIDAVKNVLIPDTDNKELKDLLTAILPALDTHLQHAEMLQQKLSK